ncbi:MAG: hypothetical protein Q8N22_03090 [bacterium]|nr:hypothetical protein [bacterium]
MNLRQHINMARGLGIAHATAVIVNFKMGLRSGDPKETDISQLTKEEKQILINAGLLKKMRR